MSRLVDLAEKVFHAWRALAPRAGWPGPPAAPPQPLEQMALEEKFIEAWGAYKSEVHARLEAHEQATALLYWDLKLAESTMQALRAEAPTVDQERIGLVHLQDGLGGAARRVEDLQKTLQEITSFFDQWGQTAAIVKRGYLERMDQLARKLDKERQR